MQDSPKFHLSGFKFSTLHELVDAAIQKEETRSKMQESRKRYNNQQGGAVHRAPQGRMITRVPVQTYRVQHPPPPRAIQRPSQLSCFTCGCNHYKRECPQNRIVCYHSNQVGHARPTCPWKHLPEEVARAQATNQPNVVRAPQPAQQNRGGFQNHGGFQARGGQPGRQFNQGAPRGRVNHVTIQEAEAATYVIIGTKSLATSGCLGIRLEIGGVPFLADHLLLNMCGLDVILGMDWLSKYKGKVDCAKNVVEMISADGTKVEFRINSKLNELKERCVNVVIAEGVMSVPIVNEYLEVFPDDLSGMPPDREVEFSIELKPGTKPIAKAPYRMSAREHDGLKRQKDELLAKGFIEPSTSEWSFPVLFAKKKDGSHISRPVPRIPYF